MSDREPKDVRLREKHAVLFFSFFVVAGAPEEVCQRVAGDEESEEETTHGAPARPREAI